MTDDRESKRRYGALFDDVRAVVNEEDPMGLIAIGAPEDEYDPEVGTILPRLSDAATPDDVCQVVRTEFEKWFDAAPAPELATVGWDGGGNLASLATLRRKRGAVLETRRGVVPSSCHTLFISSAGANERGGL